MIKLLALLIMTSWSAEVDKYLLRGEVVDVTEKYVTFRTTLESQIRMERRHIIKVVRPKSGKPEVGKTLIFEADPCGLKIKDCDPKVKGKGYEIVKIWDNDSLPTIRRNIEKLIKRFL